MATTLSISLQDCSQKARTAIRSPARRGTFRDLDAARAQQALLSVADGSGQARLYWLIDMDHMTIADARFLSFGHLASHAVMEAWTDKVKGQVLDEALATSLDTIEASLRDDQATPAFGAAGLDPLAFVSDLQDLAKSQVPKLVILPKPVEVERYRRKREQDWDEHDQTWLPLSLMQKIMKVQALAATTIAERLGQSDFAWELDGVNDDFLVRLSFSKGDGTTVATEQRPIVTGFIQEALRANLHPQITVEDVSDG